MANFNTAQFRATAGNIQAFGATPQDALSMLLKQIKSHEPTPRIIWPYNRGDAFFFERAAGSPTGTQAAIEHAHFGRATGT
jgi:hypothetical protein